MRALVFAHHAKTGRLSATAHYALPRYRRHFEKVIVVSTSLIKGDCADLVRKHSDAVIERANEGYDFFSWKTGLNKLGELAQFSEVVLANDSVAGPFGDPASFFAAIRKKPNDVCGLTASSEFGWHVQSYFLRFNRAPINSGALDAFFRSVGVLQNKQEIIQQYEVGLTQFMKARDHSVAALFDPPEKISLPHRLAIASQNVSFRQPHRSLIGLYRTLRIRDLNPTHYFWREILDSGVPFIKRELIRDNPGKQSIKALSDELQRRYNVDANMLARFAE